MAKAQTTGRIGELSVELELTSKNWLVGNFNSNIQNAAVYDLFAVKKNNKNLLELNHTVYLIMTKVLFNTLQEKQEKYF